MTIMPLSAFQHKRGRDPQQGPGVLVSKRQRQNSAGPRDLKPPSSQPSESSFYPPQTSSDCPAISPMMGMEPVQEEPDLYFCRLFRSYPEALLAFLGRKLDQWVAQRAQPLSPCSSRSIKTCCLVIGAGWHPQRGKGSTLFGSVGHITKAGCSSAPELSAICA